MKILALVLLAAFQSSHAVTPETQADLVRLRARARMLLGHFRPSSESTVERHRLEIAELIEEVRALGGREFSDRTIQRLYQRLAGEVRVTIASPVQEIIRKAQVLKLATFAMEIGEDLDHAEWRRERDWERLSLSCGILAEYFAKVDDLVETRDRILSLQKWNGPWENAFAGHVERFDKFHSLLRAAAAAEDCSLQRERLGEVLALYFELEDLREAECAASLTNAAKEPPIARP